MAKSNTNVIDISKIGSGQGKSTQTAGTASASNKPQANVEIAKNSLGKTPWSTVAGAADKAAEEAEDEEKKGYDAGEITDRERKAAENQSLVSGDNVLAVQNQLARQLENYDFADQQNRALADVQLRQNQRKTSADRYEAQRDLQNATLGLLGSMGTAMNGSSTGNLLRMLENRNDKENNTYWAQHQQNQDAVENAYQDSLNQNNVARRDAMQSAEKAIRDIEADWAANLNNINPNLFRQGAVNGIGHLSSTTAWKDNPRGIPKANKAVISGYLQPDQAENWAGSIGNPVRNAIDRERNITSDGRRRSSTDRTTYFGELMNRLNNARTQW